ncbi:hypothetical protein [Methylobacterium brachiatum]|jgi:hypothetical protein
MIDAFSNAETGLSLAHDQIELDRAETVFVRNDGRMAIRLDDGTVSRVPGLLAPSMREHLRDGMQVRLFRVLGRHVASQNFARLRLAASF